MSRKVIALIGVVAVVLVAGTWWMLRGSATDSETLQQATFPVSRASLGLSVTRTVPMQTSDGGTIDIPDFSTTEQPEWTGPWGYLAGGDPAGNYLITYVPENPDALAAIFVTLAAEPLGEVRLAAEQELQATLGLSQAQLCSLSGISVGTAPNTNEQYDNRELGLSFCPGAVPLP